MRPVAKVMTGEEVEEVDLLEGNTVLSNMLKARLPDEGDIAGVGGLEAP